jgi:hypothetical protein
LMIGRLSYATLRLPIILTCGSILTNNSLFRSSKSHNLSVLRLQILIDKIYLGDNLITEWSYFNLIMNLSSSDFSIIHHIALLPIPNCMQVDFVEIHPENLPLRVCANISAEKP